MKPLLARIPFEVAAGVVLGLSFLLLALRRYGFSRPSGRVESRLSKLEDRLNRIMGRGFFETKLISGFTVIVALGIAWGLYFLLHAMKLI